MWKTVKLGEACLVRRGTTITKKQTVEGEVPVIGGGTKPTYFHNESNRAANCITVSGSGASAGFVNKWEAPIFASDCSTIEPKDETQLHQFVYYYLMSQQQFIYDNFRSGAAQPHVYAKDIETLDYPIVSLAEQQRIVAKLDAAFAEIDRAVEVVSEQRRNSSDVYSTILTEKLSRLEKDTKLDECCSFLNGYAFKSNEAVEETDVQLLRMGNLYNNVLDLERKPVFYPSEFAQNYSKYVINSGDIVMTLTGTVGKQDYGYAIKVPETDRTLLLNQRILKLHNFDDSRVNQDFLLYVLRSQSFLSELYSTANGARQANLSSETIKNLKIPLPSIITQNELVRSLQSIELASTAYFDAINQKATELSSLKSALLTQELQPPQSEAA